MTTPTPAAQKAAQEICQKFHCYSSIPWTGDAEHATPAEASDIAAIIDRHVGAWLPIEEAPKDGSFRIIIAQFRGKELVDLDFDAVLEKESESWEMPQEYWVWKSAFGRVEEPTHFMILRQCPAKS